MQVRGDQTFAVFPTDRFGHTLNRTQIHAPLTRARLTDRRLVTRDTRPIWAETYSIDAEFLRSPNAALLGDARAFATIALLAPHAEHALPALRAALCQTCHNK